MKQIKVIALAIFGGAGFILMIFLFLSLIVSCTSKSKYVTLDTPVQEASITDWELVDEIEGCRLYRKPQCRYTNCNAPKTYLYWTICNKDAYGNRSTSITSIP